MKHERKRIPVHPGEVLSFEFLEPMSLSQEDLARHLNLPQKRIALIVEGRGTLSASEAWMLSGAFGTTPRFWLNLQANHDLVRTKPKQEIKRLRTAKPGKDQRKNR